MTTLGLGLAGVSSCRHRALISARIAPTVERGVAGLAFDSLAGVPLVDARIELVDAARPATSPTTLVADSSGGFARRDLAPARYLATFYHPRLDSLGIQASTFLIDLRGARGVWLTVGIPSATQLRTMFCGEHSDSTGLLIGRILDARTQLALDGAVVTGEWVELDQRSGKGVQVRRPYSQTISRIDGSFALCDLPRSSDFWVQAEHPGKRSGAVGIKIAASGVTQRDLMVGDSEHVIVRGNVVGGNGAPVPRARVSAIGTLAEVTADENGVFALPVEHGGTQTLIARAIGYSPEEHAVDVRPDHPSWVELELPKTASVLDTVHTRMRRLLDGEHASAVGTVVTASDIETKVPRSATDLLGRSPSTPLTRLANGHLGVRVRGVSCLPMIVLDGHSLPILQDLTEIDAMVDLNQIARMEIYTAGEIPPAYMTGSPCAAVVISTKRR